MNIFEKIMNENEELENEEFDVTIDEEIDELLDEALLDTIPSITPSNALSIKSKTKEIDFVGQHFTEELAIFEEEDDDIDSSDIIKEDKNISEEIAEIFGEELEDTSSDFSEYDSDNDSLDEDADDILLDAIFDEGVNLDTRDIFKRTKREVKASIKLAKQFLKANKFKEAKREIYAANKNVDKAYAEIVKLGNNINSTILGYFSNMTLGFVDAIPSLLLSIPTFGISAMVKGVKNTLQSIRVIIKDYKDSKEKGLDGVIKSGTENINFYKLQAKRILMDWKDKIKKTLNKIEQAEKASRRLDEGATIEEVENIINTEIMNEELGFVSEDSNNEIEEIFGFKSDNEDFNF